MNVVCYIFSLIPQDRTIAVWDIKSPKEIVLKRVLVGHRAAVNVVDFDEKYIVSASGDRTIKVSVTTFSTKSHIPSGFLAIFVGLCTNVLPAYLHIWYCTFYCTIDCK